MPLHQSELFLLPANCLPRQHQTIETTDIMLQMVAAGRGVAALPGWLIEEYAERIPLHGLRLGEHGIAKHIYLGVRRQDLNIDYVNAFIELAKGV